ncbi:hypothetical protein BH23PLA1_BH23PLA1_16820 [soil metagenome]
MQSSIDNRPERIFFHRHARAEPIRANLDSIAVRIFRPD